MTCLTHRNKIRTLLASSWELILGLKQLIHLMMPPSLPSQSEKPFFFFCLYIPNINKSQDLLKVSQSRKVTDFVLLRLASTTSKVSDCFWFLVSWHLSNVSRRGNLKFRKLKDMLISLKAHHYEAFGLTFFIAYFLFQCLISSSWVPVTEVLQELSWNLPGSLKEEETEK